MTRLERIKARAKAATEGPWEWAEGTPSIIRKWNGLRCIIAQVKSMWLEWHENHGKASEEAGHNADFIANSRSDIDWLVERVEKLPTTADGVVCVGGEIVWLGEDHRVEMFIVVHLACSDPVNGTPGSNWAALHVYPDGRVNGAYSAEVECCHSTEEAALEAARKGLDT